MECDSGDKNRKEQKTRNTKENKKSATICINQRLAPKDKIS